MRPGRDRGPARGDESAGKVAILIGDIADLSSRGGGYLSVLPMFHMRRYEVLVGADESIAAVIKRRLPLSQVSTALR